MARTKKQHYVTRAYLEGFLRPPSKQLMCYGRGRGPFQRIPQDVAHQRNYYAVRRDDGAWDDSLEQIIGSSVEDPGLPVVRKLASGKTRLDWQERERLSLLIAFQEMRTPYARERARAISKTINEQVFRTVRSADPKQDSFETVNKSGKSVVITLDELTRSHDVLCDDHSMEIHRSLMRTAVQLFSHYRHMKFTVFYTSDDKEFITTDTPVIRVFSNTAPLGSGIDRPDVEIRFPLSRKAFLVLTHDSFLLNAIEKASDAKRLKLLEALPEIRVRQATEREVDAFNRGHARHAHQWMFASQEMDWASSILSKPSASPKLMDLSGPTLLHLQSRVNYDPRIDSQT